MQKARGLSTMAGYSGYSPEQGDKVTFSNVIWLLRIIDSLFQVQEQVSNFKSFWSPPKFLRYSSSLKDFNIYSCLKYMVSESFQSCSLKALRAAIAKSFYGGLGVDNTEIFVSDGAKCDIARLQVTCIVWNYNISTHLWCFSAFLGLQICPPSVSQNVTERGRWCVQVLFGPNATMAAQDPSYPVQSQSPTAFITLRLKIKFGNQIGKDRLVNKWICLHTNVKRSTCFG